MEQNGETIYFLEHEMAAFAGTKFKYQELAYQQVGLLLFLKISAAIQTSVAKFFRIRINGLKTELVHTAESRQPNK